MTELLTHSHSIKRSQLIVFAGVAVVVGIVIATIIYASGTPIAFEAESGTVDGASKTVSVSGASGSGAVKFGSASTTSNPLANLPLIPWEGGPAYWNQFAITKAAGWSDPSFFPMVVWYGGFSHDNEVQFDKSYGINSYVEMDSSTPYSMFANNGVFWIGDKLNSTFPSNGTNWVGDFLDDEIDGRYTIPDGLAYIKSLVNNYGNDGRFKYANFTQIVMGDYGATNNTGSENYVNSYDGPSSIDMYYYTVPLASCKNSFQFIAVTADLGHCATSSSYGKTIKAMRLRDAADGKLKPMWQYVEDLSGGPADGSGSLITPGQLEGAAMDSIINEARGIIWFNTSFTNKCSAGGVIRQYEVSGSSWCGATQMEAMKEVNTRIKALAPVINTQSYQYNFGTNLDTMLKWYNGSAYVFAMISGDASSQAGNRTFTLPAGLANASSVTVLNENRTISVVAGKFTDNFAAEYSYHIYKITP